MKSYKSKSKKGLSVLEKLNSNWLKQVPYLTSSSELGVSEKYVEDVYKECNNRVMSFIKSHSNYYKLGGNRVIILIDWIAIRCKNKTNLIPEEERFLALVEVKNIPPKFYIEKMNKKNFAQIGETIKKMLHPGSILIFTQSTCSELLAESLNARHPLILLKSDLIKFDTPEQNSDENMKEIWKTLKSTCVGGQKVFDVECWLHNLMLKQTFLN